MFIREFSQFLPALQSYTISFAYFTLSIYTFFFLSHEGVQNRSPQDVLMWNEDYFELKAIKTLRVHEKETFTSPLKNLYWETCP